MLFLEPLRAALELAALPLMAPLTLTAKRGDGHSVLVIPGFTATDNWTAILRGYLRFLGYRAEAWELGRNLGYRNLGSEAERLHARVREVYEASGRKISIVGWSMGGVMARNAARAQPEMVRQVVTLAAPFTGNPNALAIRGIYEALAGERLDSPAVMRRFERDRAQPSVPTTSIYTKTDGVAAWRNCLEQEGPQAENIEVVGSHAGLVVNPLALRLLADRLAEPENGWKPYKGRLGHTHLH
jgi:pimeloyl-ACP methyl ester carboxylesterase